MKPTRVFLIGPPAAGKTTLGRRWAHCLKVPFRDTDEEIIKRTKRSIAEWFAEGEASFRAVEWKVIQEILSETSRGIVSIGGGFPAQPGGMDWLRSNGFVLWIDPPSAWLIARLRRAAADRPLLQSLPPAAQIKLIESRRPFYRQADLHWRPERIPEALIERWLRRVLRVFSEEVSSA